MRRNVATDSVVVHNAGPSLPDIEALASFATAATTSTIACLNFTSEFRPAQEVAEWTEHSSDCLAAARMHLLTFNSDLVLATGRSADLSPGLHLVAPRILLVVRLWIPHIASGGATVGFVGSGAVCQPRFAGSLWAHELLKPADLGHQGPCRTVITDVHVDQLTARSADRPLGRDPRTLHNSLGRAVVQRLSPATVWAPGPSSTSTQRYFGKIQSLPPGSTKVARLLAAGASSS